MELVLLKLWRYTFPCDHRGGQDAFQFYSVGFLDSSKDV